ncbi:uncharacterized protein LOC109601079 isoform X2 [Aethina tumida]|uniref:uncharacterized protein LOC109601079 isoform X2 n=1 Tax=Aethina tumida TaxID=116153 RepID=UPI0021493DC0|nr:uncharacterized protein LOC109601079 isoform X2 [Aethina tumida]
MRSIIYFCVVLICIGSSQSAETVNGTALIPEKSNATTTVTTSPIATTTRRPLLQGLRLPCSCQDGQCGCCTGYILDRFNQKACLNITYEPDDFALTAAMSMNGKVLYKNSISGKNPPPMCIRVPRLQFIRFCVEFSNVYIASRNIHLCIDAEANWDDFTLLEWSFDCVRLGASGVAIVPPEEGGGLPPNSIDTEDQTDEDYDDSARNVPLDKEKLIRKPAVNKIIFDSNIRSAAKVKPNRSNVQVKKLSNGDYFISYVKGHL